jgi:hypothetical protein
MLWASLEENLGGKCKDARQLFHYEGQMDRLKAERDSADEAISAIFFFPRRITMSQLLLLKILTNESKVSGIPVLRCLLKIENRSFLR